MDYMIYSAIILCIVVLTLQVVKIMIESFCNYTYKGVTLAVMVDKTTEDIEMIVKNFIWNSEKDIKLILCDVGTTSEIEKICTELEKMYDNVYYCKDDDMQKLYLKIKDI